MLIRERFEIQVVPPVWGRLPFLAVPDTSDYNLPRFEGSRGEAGNRGPRFIVAGVTTSDVDEHPFVRTPARPVRIAAKDGRGGVLDAEVDRGAATYPQPLPGEDDRAGWGATEGTSAYTVSIHAAARGIFPLRSLEVLRNSEAVAEAEADGGRHAEISEELRIDGDSWVACRAFGAGYHLDEWGRQVFAHTSPVYVACGGDWAMTDPEGIRYIRTIVEGARDYVRHTAVRRSDQVTTPHHGEANHLAWLERPFTEALHALDDRGGERGAAPRSGGQQPR